MHIIEIVLDGFKSYATRTVISGFDPQFNAITGLNGSGKSNVLDSICFVLGISNLSQVRASNLNELIYKQGQAGVTKASVTLVFDNSDRELSPHGYDHYKKITVTRQVAIGGRNKYLINGQNAQLQRVQNLFHSVGLNVNNPHFLIMQGRITKVLNMKPAETLGMIEEAAGTRMFELKKQQSIKIMAKKEAKLDEIQRLIGEDIAPRLERLGAERAQYLQYSTLVAANDGLLRFCQAFELWNAEQIQHRLSEAQEKEQAEAASLQEATEAAAAEAERKRKEAKAIDTHAAAGGAKEGRALEAAEAAASKRLVQATALLRRAADAATADADAAASHTAAADEAGAARPAAAAAHAAAAAAAAAAAEAHGAAAAEARGMREEYEAELGMGAAKGSDGAKNLQGQLSDATARVKTQETAVAQAEMRAKAFRKDVATAEKAAAAAAKTGDQERSPANWTPLPPPLANAPTPGSAAHVDRVPMHNLAVPRALAERARLEAAAAAAAAALAALRLDPSAEPAAAANHAAATHRAAALSSAADAAAAALGGAAEFRYRDPEPRFDRSKVKGTVASLMRVPRPADATALEALAGGKLQQVVVDDEKTGMLLLTKGGLTRRVTLIPLNKIKAAEPTPAQLKQVSSLVGSRAVPAVSLVEADAELRPAIQHVFGAAFVCEDRESARAVCDRLRLKCVTRDGDIYDPHGTLTGGSRPTGNASLLVRMAELRQASRAAAEAVADAEAAAAVLGEARARAEAHEAAAAELEMQTHRLSVHTQTVEAGEAHALGLRLSDAKAQLVRAQEDGRAAALALKEAVAARDAIQARLSGGDRDSLLAQSKAAIAAADKRAAAKAKALTAAQQSEQKLALALETLDAQMASSAAAAAAAAARAAAAAPARASAEAAVASARDEYDRAEAAVAGRATARQSAEEEVARLHDEAEAADRAAADAQLELRALDHRRARAKKDIAGAADKAAALLQRNPWMEAERRKFGQPGGEFDFGDAKHVAAQQHALADQSSTLATLSKRINKKVLAMFEKAQAEYSDLVSKKETVQRDKAKIEAVIAECGVKKIEALQATWAKVNADFGSIFSTLLPGSSAKLEPEEGKPVEEGLTVKVAFGSAWKQSLLELSGGQRSLVALSLVLSLLRFKPAPVYILDEIDAALDLSHTQNIGAMIKSHFQQSQFLVVSLKEGMFSNANVLFRTKFVDGVSTISRSVPSAAARAAAGAAGEADGAAGKGKAAAGRKALAAVN